MKTLLFFVSLVSLWLLPACSTQKNLTNLVKALAKDPASVNINLSSVYGTLRFERFVPATNAVTATDLAAMLQAYQFSRFIQPAPSGLASSQIFFQPQGIPLTSVPVTATNILFIPISAPPK